jgi:predicted HTH transcriptional regulator
LYKYKKKTGKTFPVHETGAFSGMTGILRCVWKFVYLQGFNVKLKIIEICKKEHLPEPEMKEQNGGFVITLFKSITENVIIKNGITHGAANGVANVPKNKTDVVSVGDVDGVANGVAYKAAYETQKYINGGTIEKEAMQVKKKLTTLLFVVAANEGGKRADYIKMTGFSRNSVDRYIKLLIENKLIEFIGSATQTGGYFLTALAKKLLK